MNEPITYPVGTGNVIGSHSAQDFVWAGRAESMSLNENNTIICNKCNADVESDPVYATLTLSCDCGNVLYEDNSDGPYDMADYFGAETATSTPADTNTPYTGPITEPIGSDVHFGADGKNSWSMAKTSNYFIGICAIIAGTVSVLGLVSTPLMDDSLRGLGFGTYFKGVKTSWNSKDMYSKTLMLATFGTLIYLGAITSLYTYRYSGRTTMGQ